VSSRTYLSIGDVLTLLREEFPDVTISKIRFLESQGLVNPERSPSGYRKFFDHDVERLRWVLRQQREHFLPLKVIRDRLADGDLDDTENGKVVEAGAREGALADDEQPTKADAEAMARILADASRRAAARMPEAAQTRPGLQVLGEGEGATAAEAGQPFAATPVSSGPAGATVSAPPAPPPPPVASPKGARTGPAVPAARTSAAASDKGSSRGDGASQRREPESPQPEHPTAAAKTPAPATPPPARRSQTGRHAAPADGGSTPAAIVTGVSLTADELCAASGLSREELLSLEGFGLIRPVEVAGMQTYDEEALTVANLAAAFRAFGIEARHLRLYHNAVDREVGLIEQVVIPLLRQRNPESRQRAVEAADQLAALGQSMRATLLRLALRQHLGG
jgi:DNA-binding transcriptional MerR regulator